MNLLGIKKIYFVGIGGIGMSAVAGLAKALGYEVSGSDAKTIYEPSITILQKYGITYSLGYDAVNFTGADLVVATAAVDNSNPEVAKALELGIPVVSYPDLLGQLTAEKRVIVVTGTHGKGTTSGLLGFVLKNLNNSSFFVGGMLRDLNTNFYYGTGPDFVIEGDEYKSSDTDLRPKFLHYNPNVLLINNLEWDHTDIYPTLSDMQKPFAEMANKVSGCVVVNADSGPALQVVQNSKAKILKFGHNNVNTDINFSDPVYFDGNFVTKINYAGKEYSLQTIFPGLIYAYDNVAAFSVLVALGYEPEKFLPLFAEYQGLKRRFEILQEQPVVLIDDYAHHPGAVKATLAAARQKYPQAKILCYFEPHTYSRTTSTLPELATAFNDANQVYISEVYSAREQKLPSSITGVQVVAEIAKNNPHVQMVADLDDLKQKIAAQIQAGDVVVAMTVGDNGTKLLQSMI